MLNNNVDIQAQFHEIHDEKVQVPEVKNKIQDRIQDLGRSMTRKRLNKTQETLQYKVTYVKGPIIKKQ